MTSVFDLLDEIRQRPGMYVGGDASQRMLQLQNLETLLSGYTLALRQHQIQEPVVDFNREFGAYLRGTKGWSLSCGPVAAVLREAVPGNDEAWQLYWRSVDEFRAAVSTQRRAPAQP